MTPLRARLFNPPNAVPDTGLNFHKGRPVAMPPQAPAEPVGRASVARVPVAPPRTKPSWLPFVVAVPRPTIAHIIAAASSVFDVPIDDIISDRRSVRIVVARQAAAVVAGRITLHSTSQIGRKLNRDHTTILSAVRKMAPFMAGIELDSHDPIEWLQALKARLET
jgi:hypothetical protein